MIDKVPIAADVSAIRKTEYAALYSHIIAVGWSRTARPCAIIVHQSAETAALPACPCLATTGRHVKILLEGGICWSDDSGDDDDASLDSVLLFSLFTAVRYTLSSPSCLPSFERSQHRSGACRSRRRVQRVTSGIGTLNEFPRRRPPAGFKANLSREVNVSALA